jgi:hypothetical protein
MNFPRLRLLLVPIALGLPFAAGGCGAPAAVVAASYGADGVSMAETGKTTTDHFASMVSKRDCALWRVLRSRPICEERDPAKPDPYKVNYDEPFRQLSEGGGVEYLPPPHAAPNAPAASWDAAAYKPVSSEPARTAVADYTPPAVEPPAAVPEAAPAPTKHKPKAKKVAKAAPARKPSPDQVASSH